MTATADSTALRTLLALGQARRPWDYLRAVGDAPPDLRISPPVRFLLGANLGSLGFADAALEVLGELDRSGATGLRTNDLRQALASRPPSALSADSQRCHWQTNRRFLGGPDLPEPDISPLWLTGGRALWRDQHRFVGTDAQAHAAAAIENAGLTLDEVPADHLPPLLIVGLSTPFLVEAALRATRPLANGYAPRIIVVEPDIQRAARALAMACLGANLPEPQPGERITLLTGPDALHRLEQHLGVSIECSLPRALLLDPLAPPDLTRRAEHILNGAHDHQHEAIDLEAARIERETQTLDRAVARVREGHALRVLIPVSRHSNFVRHSAADIADALSALGHTPVLLTEPEPHATLSRLAYLRAWADTNPDLVLSINHPRWRSASALPERAPSICWVQDAMPHHFEDASAKQGPFDFLVGYRFHEMTDRFGHHPDRVIDACVPVSPAKFHNGPVDDAARERFTCDVAFATRQSETPEAMARRLRTDMPGGTAASVVVERIFEALGSLIGDDRCTFASFQLEAVARDALSGAGIGSVEPTALDEIVRLLVMPLADRLLRHQTAHRTAAICARRGWSFALYGSGWENHPTLSEHARGELAHGEELRAAYRCAGVHLNASAHSLVHQRMIECVLSGGRVLCYRRAIDLMEPRWRLLSTLACREPDGTEEDGSPLYAASNHAEVASHFERCDRLGVTEVLRRGDSMRIQAEYIDHYRELGLPPVDDRASGTRSALIDHASFTTTDQLEAMLERAIEDRDQYDSAMRPIRDTGAECYGTVAVVGRVLQTLGAAV